MKIVEIPDIFKMETGAPEPTLLASGSSLTISFYKDVGTNENVFPCYILRFKQVRYHSFGTPNDEALNGHPYYKLGLRSYSFYMIERSDLIEKLQSINSVHPYYNASKWSNLKHYIITFKEQMFECVASEYEIEEYENSSPNEQVLKLLTDSCTK